MREFTILLVEGKGLGDNSLASALKKNGYQVKVVHTGAAAYELVCEQAPDLIVFDASSMRSSGVRSCRRLRRCAQDVPVIHTRATDEPEDRDAEANVYLAQPFTSRKILNRIHALLPAQDTEEQIVRSGDITLYMGKRSVEVKGGNEHQLTPKLAQLLELFLRNPNEIITRKQLMQDVWQTDYIGDTRTLDVHIRWVRELIEVNPGKPKVLRTVRGKGYILQIPLSQNHNK